MSGQQQPTRWAGTKTGDQSFIPPSAATIANIQQIFLIARVVWMHILVKLAEWVGLAGVRLMHTDGLYRPPDNFAQQTRFPFQTSSCRPWIFWIGLHVVV